MPAIVEFNVLPPLWLRPWFVALAVTMIALRPDPRCDQPHGRRVPAPCRATLEIFDNATSRTGILYQGNIPPPCRGLRCAQPY